MSKVTRRSWTDVEWTLSRGKEVGRKSQPFTFGELNVIYDQSVTDLQTSYGEVYLGNGLRTVQLCGFVTQRRLSFQINIVATCSSAPLKFR